MTFSADTWAANAALYETIRTMPFNEALAAGTLEEEGFKHYMVQDAHYLVAFGRALAVAAAKADDPDGVVQFSEAAKVAIIVERALHGGFFQQFGITPEAFAAAPLSPACHHYSSYLLATAWSESYPVMLAALLPCFWIYQEVGSAIRAEQDGRDNPFAAWIDTYADEAFARTVAACRAEVDRAAERADGATRDRMTAAFVRACEYEWLFWDSAHQQRGWPA